MIKKLIFPIILLLFSCERIIDIDSVNVKQELVVSALIHTDEVDSLLLSSTYNTVGTTSSYSDSGLETGVSGATIVVLTQGKTIGKYVEKSQGSYYYEGNNFQENKEYSLSIQHPDFQEVLANTTVPLTPEFELVIHFINDENTVFVTGATLQVLLDFVDVDDKCNYYCITASRTRQVFFRDYYNQQKIDSVVLYTDPTSINSKSSIIEMSYNGSSYQFVQNDIDWESGYRVSYDELIFSDKLFNGQKVTIPIDLNVSDFKNTTQVHLTLTAISEEYYLFLRSMAAYRKSENGFFPEALQMYSNVVNGQGVWASKTSKSLSLDVSEL